MTVEDAYPLTRLQAGMLFHSQLDAGMSTYHDLSSLRVTGPFDEALLHRVLAVLVAGHEVLRSSVDLTRFSEPMQLVHDVVEPVLTVQDLRGAADVEQRIARWREEEKVRPFDLATPPLLRVHAQRMTDEEFWLNLSFHHAILDGWSLSLLTSWLLRSYDDALSGQQPEKPRLATRFRDYVLLERKALADDTAQAYWRNLVRDTEVAELPRWGATGAARSAKVHSVPFADGMTEQVRAIAAQARVATKAVLFAAHAAVLARLSGQHRVVIGRVANCRLETADAEQMMGVFLNVLPLVLDTRGTSWLDLVRRTHQAEVDALAHRHYPLGQILRDVSQEAVFDTLVDYRAMRSYGGISLRHLTVAETDFFEQTNFGFTANYGADPQTRQIRLRINYDAAEFAAEQIETIGGYYAAALEAMAADVSAPVSRTPLLGKAERARQLVEWNDTATALPPDPTLPVLLAGSARRHPGKIALRVGERELTYAQLHARANRLAWLLRERGVGPDIVVGVHMRRSPELLVALLAVLKSGGAYLPLDPDYPAHRLAFMLADSGAPIVLADSGAVPESAAAVITVGADDVGAGRDDEPADTVRPDDLAYVLYTSGSTGLPKGVQIPHRALVNLLLSMSSEVDLTGDDHWLAITSLSFDIAGLEVFAPLLAGAELVVLPDKAVDGPALLAELRRATIAQATPSSWRLLIEAGLGEEPGIRAICGGEALPSDLAERLATRMGAVWNAYGPTETTIWSCLQRVRAGEPVTIGRPLANTRVYVLDDELRPVPTGATGELYLGGDGLARGYRDQTGLTATRFVADPFGTPGSRLFRTGDTVRWTPDGRLDFLGRSDYQVKVRGYRIELGEIESVLTTHPSVGQAVVVPRPDDLGEHQLVAYIVATAPGTPAELRTHLALTLPDYMVPSAFVVLEEFPLTPNGKIDRKALPVAGRTDSAAGEVVTPAEGTEALIAEVWAQELGRDWVGATDTFRELGGHSIAALRVVLRIKEATGAEVPIARLLADGTVAVLAEMIDSGRREAGSVLVPLRHATGEAPLFLVHPLGGSVFCYAALADAVPVDQPVYGLQSYDLAGSGGPRPATVEDIAEHYLREIRAVQPEGPYRLGGWCMGGVVAYEMARRLQEDGERTSTLAIIDSSIVDPVPPQYVEDEAAAMLGAFGDSLPITPEELRRIDPEERVRHVLSLAEGLSARPDAGTEEDLRRLVEVYQRHAKALLTYRDTQRSTYRGHVVVVRGESAEHADGDLGWGPWVDGQVVMLDTPGDHFSMLSKTNAPGLAERLMTAIHEADSR